MLKKEKKYITLTFFFISKHIQYTLSHNKQLPRPLSLVQVLGRSGRGGEHLAREAQLPRRGVPAEVLHLDLGPHLQAQRRRVHDLRVDVFMLLKYVLIFTKTASVSLFLIN